MHTWNGAILHTGADLSGSIQHAQLHRTSLRPLIYVHPGHMLHKAVLMRLKYETRVLKLLLPKLRTMVCAGAHHLRNSQHATRRTVEIPAHSAHVAKAVSPSENVAARGIGVQG